MTSNTEHPNGPHIPETPHNLQLKLALTETLEKAKEAGLDLYLTGGTAAAVYAGETRPLSLDLDFFVNSGSKEKVEKVFGGKFRYFGEKKLFKSDKLVGMSGNNVDLDFIVEQNIVPDEKHPDDKITLSLNEFARNKGCESDFMGEPVKVLPPELIVIAKLFAGRGKELGKYDLSDSEAIIETGLVRQDIFTRAAMGLAGDNDRTRQLVVERLSDALAKLKQTPNVQALAKAITEAQNTGAFDVERITEVTRESIPKI